MDIAPALQEEIDTEWTWADYPMPWCTHEEVRQVSADAQRIHDDIATGRLTVHLHSDELAGSAIRTVRYSYPASVRMPGSGVGADAVVEPARRGF
ncbi:hypothetical protein [Streptomyces sp. NPDC056401]|uniref:hypothetical protein n=1 Tax=Streptomyces sp. NPDC056401 TaxID=3345809 RepID=UPI0035DCEFAB